MSRTGPPSCPDVDSDLEELALGMVWGPSRVPLMEHLHRCATCQRRVDDMSRLADRLLLEATAVEPPDGFESRVLARLAPDRTGPAARRQRAPRRVAAAVAVAAVVALAGLGGWTLRSTSPAESANSLDAVSSGVIRRADGTANGQVLMVARPRPMVLVTIDQPRPSANRVSCELVDAQGQATIVGTWGYPEVERGAWAVGVDDALLDAVTMNVLASDGTVLATADLR